MAIPECPTCGVRLMNNDDLDTCVKCNTLSHSPCLLYADNLDDGICYPCEEKLNAAHETES